MYYFGDSLILHKKSHSSEIIPFGNLDEIIITFQKYANLHYRDIYYGNQTTLYNIDLGFNEYKNYKVKSGFESGKLIYLMFSTFYGGFDVNSDSDEIVTINKHNKKKLKTININKVIFNNIIWIGKDSYGCSLNLVFKDNLYYNCSYINFKHIQYNLVTSYCNNNYIGDNSSSLFNYNVNFYSPDVKFIFGYWKQNIHSLVNSKNKMFKSYVFFNQINKEILTFIIIDLVLLKIYLGTYIFSKNYIKYIYDLSMFIKFIFVDIKDNKAHFIIKTEYNNTDQDIMFNISEIQNL